jgi:hypothetical protein
MTYKYLVEYNVSSEVSSYKLRPIFTSDNVLSGIIIKHR